MKLTIAAITLILAAGICSYALAQKDSGRPIGIPASQWIPLGDRAGIVISDYQPGDAIKTSQGLIQPLRVQSLPPPDQTALLARQQSSTAGASIERQRASEDSKRGYVDGYFVVKRGSQWIRLSVVPPPQLLGALKPKDSSAP